MQFSLDRIRWIIDHYILGHHPKCVAYKSDTFNLGKGVRICKGCTLTYTGFFYGLVTAIILNASIMIYFWAIAGMLSIALTLELLRLKKSIPREIPRVLLGGSLAFIGYFTILLPETWKQIIFYVSVLIGLGLTFPLRMKSMKSRCADNCGVGNHFKNCGVLDYNSQRTSDKDGWIPLLENN